MWPERGRWRLRAAAAIAAITVLALGWRFLASRQDIEAGPKPSADAIRNERVALPAIAVAARSLAPAAPDPALAHAPDEVQICGGAWIRGEPDGSVNQADFERATQLPKARAAILAKLNAEPGEMPRLAALLMTAGDRDDQHRRALIGLPATCDGAECAASQAAEADVAQAREAIARAALASSDPKVYALALNVCGKRREGACQLLNVRQWARLDPGNASPWLQILEEASAHKDANAQTEALYRIASAERNEFGAFTLAGALLKAAPADDSSTLASFVMAITAVGVEAAWILPGYLDVNRLCRVDALHDANRAQVCAGVASVLADHSDTMIGRKIGAAIGTRIGWPAERAEQIRGEYDAYISSFGSPADQPRNELSCVRIRRELDRLRQMAALGEVGAMREWIARSGMNAQDFVLVDRKRQQWAQRAAQEAAASAAAASAGG